MKIQCVSPLEDIQEHINLAWRGLKVYTLLFSRHLDISMKQVLYYFIHINQNLFIKLYNKF